MPRSRGLVQRCCAALLTLALALSVLASAPSVPAQAAAGDDVLSRYKLVLTTRDLGTDGIVNGWQHLVTVNGDGTDLRVLSPLGEQVYYDWPAWAFNGAKIVYSARRTLDPTSTENIYMSNADGSGTVQLTFTNARTGQPHITADGRYLIFNAVLDEYPVVGLYRLDLETGLVENLSQQTPGATNDADPRWSADGRLLALAGLPEGAGPDAPTQIFTVRNDGTGRQRITNDPYYSTDPSITADGRFVAFSAYRGGGRTVEETALADTFLKDFQKAGRAKLTDWRIVVRDVASGSEREITQGENCVARPPNNPCSPTQGSGWVPIFVDGGQRVAYLSPLSSAGMGVYLADVDGSRARAVVEAPGKVINWHDWTEINQPAQSAPARLDHLALPYDVLLGGPVYDTIPDGESAPPAKLFRATRDLFYVRPLSLTDADGNDLAPSAARWMPGKKSIVFSAAPVQGQGVADQPGAYQVYLADADGGAARALTTPATEDALEPIAQADDLRDNVDPDVSPDGRYVVFTNRSRASGLAWLLRLDLRSGEIVNLSARTRGILAGVDQQAQFSPDGQRIAFIGTTPLGTYQVMTMRWDGQDVRQVTDDERFKASPTWSPDGRSLAYAAVDASGADGASSANSTWALVKVDVQSGEQTSLVRTPNTVQRPAWSADGQRIGFITLGRLSQPDIAMVQADGSDSHPFRTSVRMREQFFDWR